MNKCVNLGTLEIIVDDKDQILKQVYSIIYYTCIVKSVIYFMVHSSRLLQKLHQLIAIDLAKSILV